jgi:hypothetical protein
MRLSPITPVLLGLLALAGPGCAQRTLTINSEPSGALVFLNGEEIGRTPMRHDFVFYGDYDVTLRKEGYQTLKTHRDLKTPINMVPPLDLFSELFGVKDRREWTFTMTPLDPSLNEAQGMVERGMDMREELRSSRYTRRPTTAPSTQPAQ